MKRIFLVALSACALIGSAFGDIVEINGYFISSTDAERLHVQASQTPELTTDIHGKVSEISPEQKIYRDWQGKVLSGGKAIEMAFDLDKRPSEITEVLTAAGYNCTSKEIDALRGFIGDYGWHFVIKTFLDDELALRHFRMMSKGSPAEIDQAAVSLFHTADELATNQVGPFVGHLVLKRHGLAK